MEASSEDSLPGELYAHLTPENRARLGHILAVRVLDVHTAIRGTEAETMLDSSIGRNNLNEAFSHVAELAANKSMSAEDQASHLADIEDHLRRAVTEHPEEVTRERLVQVGDRWQEYLLEARLYRETKAMVGVPYHSELEDDRAKIGKLMEEARSMKMARVPWDQTLEIAAKMTEAASVVRKLDDKLVQCIGAARELKAADERQAQVDARADAQDKRAEAAETRADRAETRSRRSFWVAVAAVVATIGIGVGTIVASDSSSTTRTLHAGQHKP
jgi:hypothetical protein